MEPIAVGPASPGNVGRDVPAIKARVANRLLSIVRERFPAAELADSRTPARQFMPADYPLATGERVVAPEERSAAGDAHQRGATHLLVTTITEWTEMRTDDPLGALLVPHNSVTINLRLMRLEPAALVGSVTFHNQARLTVNQQAIGLLNDRFRRTVLQLLSGPGG